MGSIRAIAVSPIMRFLKKALQVGREIKKRIKKRMTWFFILTSGRNIMDSAKIVV